MHQKYERAYDDVRELDIECACNFMFIYLPQSANFYTVHMMYIMKIT